MSATGIMKALESELSGDLRLAFLAIGDGSGLIHYPAICRWVGCDQYMAENLVLQLEAMGYVTWAGDMHFAPALYDGYIPVTITERRRPTAEMRRKVFSRDGATCRYCGDTFGPFHLDHVIPHSRGGVTSADNLVVACGPCNMAKSDKTPEEMGWAS